MTTAGDLAAMPPTVPDSPAAEDHRPAPGRHGADLARARQLAARLRLTIPGDPEPTPADWHALGQAHWRGDPLADAVVAWALSEGMAVAWPIVEQALAAAYPHVTGPDTPPVLRAYLDATHAAPPWLDWRRVRRGAHVLQSTGLHGLMVLRDVGLMAGYQASAINQTLVQTGALSHGVHKRVAETAAWWLDCTADGGLVPGALGHRQTLRVRLMHALVRQRLVNAPQWDAAWLGVPINQVDMQATYLAFSVAQLLGLRMTGMLVGKADADAVMHLWRYIGWLMGVEEGLLCDDEAQGRVLLYRNLLTQAPPDHTSAQLARALMDEPLSRPYPWAPVLRGHIDRERHLSLVNWFLGAQAMRDLGLPQRPPWYPLMLLAPTAVGSVALKVVPGLSRPWRAVARWQQTRFHEQMRAANTGELPHGPSTSPADREARAGKGPQRSR